MVQSVFLLTTAESHVTPVHSPTLQTHTPIPSFCRLPAIPSSHPSLGSLPFADTWAHWFALWMGAETLQCVWPWCAPPQVKERVKGIAVRKSTRWCQRESESARCIWRRTLDYLLGKRWSSQTQSWIMYHHSGNRPNSDATVLIMTTKTLKTLRCCTDEIHHSYRVKISDISSWNHDSDCSWSKRCRCSDQWHTDFSACIHCACTIDHVRAILHFNTSVFNTTAVFFVVDFPDFFWPQYTY